MKNVVNAGRSREGVFFWKAGSVDSLSESRGIAIGSAAAFVRQMVLYDRSKTCFGLVVQRWNASAGTSVTPCMHVSPPNWQIGADYLRDGLLGVAVLPSEHGRSGAGSSAATATRSSRRSCEGWNVGGVKVLGLVEGIIDNRQDLVVFKKMGGKQI